VRDTRTAARALGQEIHVLHASTEREIDAAFATLIQLRAGALVVPSSRSCRTSTRGVPRVNDRRVLNGIFYVLRSGAPWRDLPDNFGPYTTCYNRFVRWRRAGVWGWDNERAGRYARCAMKKGGHEAALCT
jgi:hypothetical protein